MASKLTALAALGGAPSADDLIYVVDDPLGTPASKKATVLNLFTSPELFTPTLNTPTVTIADAVTNAVSVAETIRHSTSGAAAAGFGVRQLFTLEDSSGTQRSAAALDVVWDNAGAGYTADVILHLSIGGVALDYSPLWFAGDAAGRVLTAIGNNAGVAPSGTASVELRGDLGSGLNIAEFWTSAIHALITETGGAVFNETGSATGDVRIEGDTDANLFFSDASADRVGIGTAAPSAKLTVAGNFLTTVVTLTDAATIATNAALSNQFTVTLTAARTLGNPTNAVNGQVIVFEIVTAGFGLTLDTKFTFGSDIPSYTPSTGTDYLTVRYNSAVDRFRVVAIVKGY